MNDELHKLLTLARRQGEIFARRPGASMVLVTGSVALGIVDEASDLDMLVFYETMPPPEELTGMRDEALANHGGIYSFDPQEGLACYFFAEGVRIDVIHQARAPFAEKIAAFVADPSTDDDTTHIIMSGIRQALALHGEGLLTGWQQQLDRLPDSYFEALVRGNLRFPPWAIMEEMGVARGDYWLVSELLLETQKRILNLLCGLNRRIPPGKIKGLDHTVDRLSIKPPAATQRLRQMWALPPGEAVASLQVLAEELLELVGSLHPQIETAPVRSRLALPLRRAA